MRIAPGTTSPPLRDRRRTPAQRRSGVLRPSPRWRLGLGCFVGLAGLLCGCAGADDLTPASQRTRRTPTASPTSAAATPTPGGTASAPATTVPAPRTTGRRGHRRDDARAGATGAADPAGSTSAVRLPPVHVPFDYQLGGAYTPPGGTRIVVRDRSDAPLPGAYSVCYVNAYQAQPDELSWWKKEHPTLLLRDTDGDVVVDPDWNEALLDISTEARRAAIRDVVGSWFASCAAKGFDAVEPDNLDSWTRSSGRLRTADAMAMARLLVAEAHGHGLAIAQKNTVEHSATLRAMGYDFATAEECTRYAECDGYARTYADRVLVVEYSRRDLEVACGNPAIGGALSVVLRDTDLLTPSVPGYVRATC